MINFQNEAPKLLVAAGASAVAENAAGVVASVTIACAVKPEVPKLPALLLDEGASGITKPSCVRPSSAMF